mmetsp:Transcript_10806/g.22878  ORF Transcript_10806/g.22878 Transcript_10806/m.22878 type:complete len:326 (-) Transcript_10806:909-1886(-)
MCIAFFEWTEDRFLVCHNRDEFFARPTRTTAWWPSNLDDGGFEILAPRDEQSGGTWFGFEKTTGRCAFLTNIREVDRTQYASTRGNFVLDYLKSSTEMSALDFLKQQFGETGSIGRNNYAGFNLVLFSGNDLAYYSNRWPPGEGSGEKSEERGPIALSMGKAYGLSNSVLIEPYVKVTKGLEIFEQVVVGSATRTTGNGTTRETTAKEEQADAMMEGLECLMQMEQAYPGDPLPRTGEPGFPEATVKHRSSICVPDVNGYGTRTTIRFSLECVRNREGDGEGPPDPIQQGQKQKQRVLRWIEKHWNQATLEWDTSMDLNGEISLR